MLMAVVLGTVACNDSEDVRLNKNTILSEVGYISQQVNALQGGHSSKRNCIKGSGNCMIAIVDDTYQGVEGTKPIILSLISPTEMKIQNQNDIENEDGEFLEFNVQTAIPQSLCSNLGVNSISIVSGTYFTDKSQNPYGNTIVTIISN